MKRVFVFLFRWGKLLERIATALERLAPPPPSQPPRKRGPEEIVNYAERTWQREQLMTELKQYGLSPNEEEEILRSVMDAIERDEQKS